MDKQVRTSIEVGAAFDAGMRNLSDRQIEVAANG